MIRRGRLARAGEGGDEAGLRSERAVLVDAVIHALDRTTSEAVRARLLAALAEVGVDPVGAPGEEFDSARHEAVGTEPAGTATEVGTVVSVDRCGFLDRGVLLRPAQVVVHGEVP